MAARAFQKPMQHDSKKTTDPLNFKGRSRRGEPEKWSIANSEGGQCKYMGEQAGS